MVALLASPASGLAQAPQPRNAQAEASSGACRTILRELPPDFVSGDDGPLKAEPVGPDGCRFGPLRFAVGSHAGWRVTSLLARGIPADLRAALAQPSAVRVEARGVTFSLRSGIATVDWVNAQQQTPFDVVLDAAYDPASRRATVNELSMEGEAVGRVALEAAMEGIDQSSGRTSVQRQAETAGLRRFRFSVDSRTFVVNYVLPPLASRLPEQDPGGAVERAKAAITAQAEAVLPQAGASPAAVAAVTAFVRDFPRPRHPFVLSVEAPAPIRIDSLIRAAGSPDATAALVRTLRVDASYEGVVR